jgi:xanthine dehydrogenase accessory factor
MEQTIMKRNLRVLIKGAGEMASGVAWRLHQSHFKVLMIETHKPLAVRRAVSFCEAVYEGRKIVEGIEAVLIDRPDGANEAWANFCIPLLVDPQLKIMAENKPDVLIEATLSKHNTGIDINDAPLVIALGPGYKAGRDSHLVVETNRGHHLGRIYSKGYANANTGVPGKISGFSIERVLRAPADGIFEAKLVLGDWVEMRQVIGTVAGEPVLAQISGILRGLIRPGTQVKSGLKVGDIDPRGDKTYVDTISEKARALGGSVLEGICRKYNC